MDASALQSLFFIMNWHLNGASEAAKFEVQKKAPLSRESGAFYENRRD